MEIQMKLQELEISPHGCVKHEHYIDSPASTNGDSQPNSSRNFFRKLPPTLMDDTDGPGVLKYFFTCSIYGESGIHQGGNISNVQLDRDLWVLYCDNDK